MPKRNLIWLGAILAGVVVTAWVVRKPACPPQQELQQGGLDCVIQTCRFLQEHSYRPPAAEALYRAAARGMVTAVDEFSSYVPPERVKAFQKRMEGRVCSTGIVLEARGDRLRVRDVLVGSPAWRQGVLPGDEILSFDGRAAGEISFAEAESLLSGGQPGSSLDLEIGRAGRPVRAVTLRREEFALETVQGLCRDRFGQPVYQLTGAGDVAYIRISEFVGDTPERLGVALRQLPGPCSLVLDLRGNPGGRFSSAIKVADMFLTQGLIATVAGRAGPPARYSASAEGTYLSEAPMVVLIDGASASGAEIVAGALKLHGRAVLIGARTRGKACLQSMLALPNGLGQVNLTTAEVFLGSAIPFARRPGCKEWGVTPHEEVFLPRGHLLRIRRLRRRGPAGRTQAASGPAAWGEFNQVADRVNEILRLDLPLAEAVRLLRRREAFQAILSGQRREEACPEDSEADERTDEHTGH